MIYEIARAAENPNPNPNPMPYRSAPQERLMRAVAHSPDFAKKVGIPQSVGKKFEGHKAEGGIVMKKPLPPFMMKKGEKSMKTMPPKAGKAKKMMSGGKAMGYAKGGGCEVKGKTKGTMR